jgi:LysR family hydrogen peroxide-inducible transcriptional activator
MNLRDLRYLIAVAEQRHFGRAAEACAVSQPTLSAQVKKLEAYLGVTLIERGGKTVAATPMGEEVVALARLAVEQADAIVELARSRRDPLAGPLRLGIIPTLGPYLLPWVMAPLAKRFPELALVVHEDLTDNLVAGLRSHSLDAALLALPIEAGDLECRPLFDEPFWLATPPGHPLAAAKTIRERDLLDANLLLLAEGHCLRDQALAVCGLGDRRPASSRPGATSGDLRATSLETLRQMVAAGYGCTLLPALAVQTGRHGTTTLDTRPLDLPDAKRRIGLLYRKSFPRRQGLERLGEAIVGCLPEVVRPLRDGRVAEQVRRTS